MAKKKAAGTKNRKNAASAANSGCDCIDQVNSRLEDRGYSIATTLLFQTVGGRASVKISPPLVAIKKIEGAKRARKGPPVVICSYCPFCGVKQDD